MVVVFVFEVVALVAGFDVKFVVLVVLEVAVGVVLTVVLAVVEEHAVSIRSRTVPISDDSSPNDGTTSDRWSPMVSISVGTTPGPTPTATGTISDCMLSLSTARSSSSKSASAVGPSVIKSSTGRTGLAEEEVALACKSSIAPFKAVPVFVSPKLRLRTSRPLLKSSWLGVRSKTLV